ncbi:MAG: hypothetical protein RL291_552 [Pseudomonadota bacterium]
MFERNRIDSGEQGTISVILTYDDGETATGRLVLPVSKTLGDVINGAQTFLEFEPYGEERSFIAKSRISSIKAAAPGRPTAIGQRLKDIDGFDPYEVLGIEQDAPWDTVRAAYFKLAMVYHPDRYATAQLPDEVVNYLGAMARRINAAYTTLEAKYTVKKPVQSTLQTPIYVSPKRPLSTGGVTR